MLCCIDPEWASASKGLFICISCSGIHRNLGAHVSVVKSLRLDTWTVEKLKVIWDKSGFQYVTARRQFLCVHAFL